MPLNPQAHIDGEPKIDPDAVIWRTLDAHLKVNQWTTDDCAGCKRCPWCCNFPGLHKLMKLSSHLGLLQANKTQEASTPNAPAFMKYQKELEFAKVALTGVKDKLPGKSYDRSDGIMDDHYSLSGKLKELDKLLKQFYEEGSKVLLFSYSTQTLDLIQNWLRSRGNYVYQPNGWSDTIVKTTGTCRRIQQG